MKRTHTCGQLRKESVGSEATVIGWVDSLRDHGGILFIDLRDRTGIIQVVLDPENFANNTTAIQSLREESVVSLTGTVTARDAAVINKTLPTGEVEIIAQSLEIHNISEVVPFPLEDTKADKVNEDLRLTYRYLDLRRPKNYHRLQTRHKAGKAVRDYLDSQDFLEIETPSLFKSTPEGAREFLVPSRIHPGHFYALAQSPQQYKQMLMVAGVERYYSIARCYRDEDLRSDRQPEFSQIDLEMSFIDREDMYELIEGMLVKIWKDVLDVDIQTPFQRMPFADAMNRFGSDKPDLRFGMEIQDVSKIFEGSSFKVFSGAVASGGVVKAINVGKLSDITQGEIKNLEDIAKTLGAKGLAYIKAEPENWKSPILKFFSEDELAQLKEQLQITDGDLIFFAATEWERACTILGRIRLESAQLLVKRERLSISSQDYKFLWVIDFPLMSYNEEEGRYEATHHPFTSPVVEDIPLLDEDPKQVRGQHYDIVLNGMELGGGSIRIHQPDLQKKVFSEILNIPEDVVESRFGYMLKAFTYGAPPHGGIALGFDRLAALLCGTTSIRDVIAFPKTQRGQDLMNNSPSPATDKQLRDIHIRTVE